MVTQHTMSELNNLTVGVLIPTFQRMAFLEESLKSVAGQTYDNTEIIVIDNGSTDGTSEFMATISDKRVRYIVNDNNIGISGSINRGINLFSDAVEWCTILSDDDVLDSDFIMQLANKVMETDAKSIIHSHRIFIDKSGNKIREAPLAPQEESALDYIKMRSLFRRETYLTGVMFSRKSFVEINGYPAFATGLATDDAFIFALALKDRLFFERNAIAYIRIHKGAESVICSDGIRKIKTILQFGEYCRSLVIKSYAFNENQIRQFENVLKIYLRALSSGYWIASAHYVLSPQNYNYEQLAELLSIAQDNPEIFTFRVKFALAFHKIFGIVPESYEGYRSLWKQYINIIGFLRRLIKP